MRRALAIFLLACFSAALLVPIASPDVASSLPACCRRGGEHHCALMDGASAPGLDTLHERCPLFPRGPAALNGFALDLTYAPQLHYALFAGHPAVEAQTEALYRISFSRSRQKRGPPLHSFTLA